MRTTISRLAGTLPTLAMIGTNSSRLTVLVRLYRRESLQTPFNDSFLWFCEWNTCTTRRQVQCCVC